MSSIFQRTEEVNKRMERAGLSRIAPAVLKLLRRSIRLVVGEQSELPVTRLGGTPNMPAKIAWPNYRSGDPHSFLAQLDLARLGICEGLPLPGSACWGCFSGAFCRNEWITAYWDYLSNRLPNCYQKSSLRIDDNSLATASKSQIMRQINKYLVLLCLVFEAPTISRCQSRSSSKDMSGQAKFNRILGQASFHDDAHASPVHNSPASPGSSVALTGILLVDDFRCDEWPADEPKDKMMCPEGGLSQWGFITVTKQYTVRGIHNELRKYERQRVMVTGTVTAATKDFPAEKLEVQSIASSEVDTNPIREMIEELRSHQWTEPVIVSNPTLWEFHLTPPMIQILQAGPAAQDVLLEYISDPHIKDQIIFLLGGVGDGNAVEPIIEAMATPDEEQKSA